MSIIVAQHTLHGPSGLPTDQYVNTLHVDTNSQVLNAATAGQIMGSIETFFNALSLFWSGTLKDTFQTTKLYDLDDPKPRAPRFENSANLSHTGAAGKKNLPCEVAICLSYEADKLSGTKQARRRGRLFLGPWTMDAIDDIATGKTNARPHPTLVNSILVGAKTMHDALRTFLMDWVVYSPTSAAVPGAVESDFAHNVGHIWVDDAFDTQRRRGVDPTKRTETLDLTDSPL